jgi:hypothetical protein
VLLIAACSTNPTNDLENRADKIVVPLVQQYTPEQYEQAHKEHSKFCLPDDTGRTAAPMLCQFLDDFGRMRDAARVAMGLKVDLNR